MFVQQIGWLLAYLYILHVFVGRHCIGKFNNAPIFVKGTYLIEFLDSAVNYAYTLLSIFSRYIYNVILCKCFFSEWNALHKHRLSLDFGPQFSRYTYKSLFCLLAYLAYFHKASRFWNSLKKLIFHWYFFICYLHVYFHHIVLLLLEAKSLSYSRLITVILYYLIIILFIKIKSAENYFFQ